MAETTAPSVKKYYDYAQEQVDEQAILDKYNAATIAQFNAQREQNRQNENAFYNQMYNTQKTAMDTIRQSNAAAVASGASRGVQAAQELSSLLGLQQESVASATELAQANRQTAQEETAAVLENVLNAYQQSVQERQQLVQQGIESASVDVQSEANKVAAQEAEAAMIQAESAKAQAEAQLGTLAQTQRDALQSAAETGLDNYLAEVAAQDKDYAGEYSLEGANSLNQALSSLTAKGTGQPNDGVYFTESDFKVVDNDTVARQKYDTLVRNLNSIAKTDGIDVSEDKLYKESLQQINALFTKDSDRKSTKWYEILGDVLTVGMVSAGKSIAEAASKGDRAAQAQALYSVLTERMKAQYASKNNTI